MGKGACIKSAIKYIDSEITIIQDADLEYNPKDYKKLIKLFSDKNIKVVYGSRARITPIGSNPSHAGPETRLEGGPE